MTPDKAKHLLGVFRAGYHGEEQISELTELVAAYVKAMDQLDYLANAVMLLQRGLK